MPVLVLVWPELNNAYAGNGWGSYAQRKLMNKELGARS